MIGLLLALATAVQSAVPAVPPAAATTTVLPVEIGRQPLPAKGCAAFLWSVSERKLIAMAGADPAYLRMAFGTKPTDLARVSEAGVGGFGFAATTSYRSVDASVTLEMTVANQPDLTEGGSVPQGTLTVERQGADALVIPVAGLIGCAPAR